MSAEKALLSPMPRLYLDDSTQTWPPTSLQGVVGWIPGRNLVHLGRVAEVTRVDSSPYRCSGRFGPQNCMVDSCMVLHDTFDPLSPWRVKSVMGRVDRPMMTVTCTYV